MLQVAGAISLRRQIDKAWTNVVGGLLSMALGAVIFFYPPAAAVSVVWIIAATALIVGGVLISFAFKLRSLAKGGA